MAVPQLYGAGIGGNVGDSQQISLVKIVAQLYDLVVTQGGMSVPQLYSKMSANPGDSPQVSLVKIVALLNEYTGSGSTGGAYFYTFDTGVPPTDGSITTQGYWDLGSNTAYVNTAWPVTAVPTWVAH